jgi:HlyD family secretion protein
VLLVPSQAVTADREAGKYYVNLVRPGSDGSSTITRTEVTVGLKDDGNTQITSGLNEGDQVLIGESRPARPGRSSVFMSGTGGGGQSIRTVEP